MTDTFREEGNSVRAGASPMAAAAAVIPARRQAWPGGAGEHTKPVGTLFNLFLVVLSPLLALATVLAVYIPGFYVAVIDPELDAVVNTATTVAAGAIAALAWIRFREADQPDAVYQAGAFLVLFAGGVFSLVLLLTGADGPLGFSSAAPGQEPLYVWTLHRLVAAALLVAGALAAFRHWRRPRMRLAVTIVLGPLIAIAVASVFLLAASDLPPLVPAETLQMLDRPIDVVSVARLATPMFFAQLVVGGLFLIAAYAYARLHAIDRRRYSGSLEIALIVAAFSQMHSAIVPGAYTGVVASADLLRLAFYGILLVGVANAARLDLRALRDANETLVKLQSIDSRRVAAEERSRVARDIHDGLIQELWLARLTTAGFKDINSLPGAARKLADRVDGILEEALAEARYAVASLRPSEPSTLGADLQRLVDDYADHFGLEIELTVDSDPQGVPDDVQTEMVRICREALNNVRKHADASVVRVRLRSDGRTIRLMVFDNGKGFDTSKAGAGFGLGGMRQRAEAIGGVLFVESEPQGGTRVIVEIPLSGSLS